MFSALLLLSASLPSFADTRGYASVDWVPFGQAELAWVDQGRLSGTGSAQTDGNLTRPLRVQAGPTWGRHGALFSLATWRETTTTWGSNPEDGSSLVTRMRQGGVRVGGEYRWWTQHLATGRPLPFVTAGLYGVIPTVQYSSETWTESEQSGWDEVAQNDRTRIASFGLSAGGGLEVRWDNGLALGARQQFIAHRGQSVDDTQSNVTVLLQTETSLSLGFVFGGSR